MKMQIWELTITDSVMAATHGQFYPIYEAYVPDLKLSINHLTSFISGEDRYKKIDPGFWSTDIPEPKIICEFELSRSQIEALEILAKQNPIKLIQKLIIKELENRNLDTKFYK